jgi:hypothetical protein
MILIYDNIIIFPYLKIPHLVIKRTTTTTNQKTQQNNYNNNKNKNVPVAYCIKMPQSRQCVGNMNNS